MRSESAHQNQGASVAFISASRSKGGAAIAAARLGEGLKRKGWTVRWLVKESARSGDESVQQLTRAWYDRLPSALMSRLGLFGFGILSSFRIVEHPWVTQADVVHLHNLHPDYFNILALPRLARRKRVVWTLHDMWAFTGHCAYSLKCRRWRSGCGRCPHLDVHPAVPRDLTAVEWRLKRRAYKNAPLCVAAPSQWLLRQATQSILKPRKAALIPYSLDTEIYRRGDGVAARRRLAIPEDAFVVLWAGFDFSEPRKGGARIASALSLLPMEIARKTVLVTMGKGPAVAVPEHRVKCVHAGYIESDVEKAEVYRSANVLLFASQADNYPVVVQESLACGTPVLAFDVGGVSELVAHEENGFLVPDGNLSGFATRLSWMAREIAQCRSLGEKAGFLASKRFALEIQAESYISELYM